MVNIRYRKPIRRRDTRVRVNADRPFDSMGSDLQRLSSAIKAIGGDAKTEFNRDVADQIWDPTEQAIKQAAGGFGPMHVKAARAVVVERRGTPTLVGNKPGKGVSNEIFFGAEFGGGNRKNYNARWPKGRRSTRQFGAHTGGDGRWFTPTVKGTLRQVPGWVRNYVDDLIASRFPGAS